MFETTTFGGVAPRTPTATRSSNPASLYAGTVTLPSGVVCFGIRLRASYSFRIGNELSVGGEKFVSLSSCASSTNASAVGALGTSSMALQSGSVWNAFASRRVDDGGLTMKSNWLFLTLPAQS